MNIQSLIEAFYSTIRERLISRPTDNFIEQDRETLSQFRNKLEPYVYQQLEQKQGHQLTKFWETHQFPKESRQAWVITERRVHPNWWFVLRNLAWAAPHMSLYIFCSEENKPYLLSLLGDKASNVHLIPWQKGTPDGKQQQKEFNDSWKNPELWKQINAEYILRIELDCFVREKIPDRIFTGDFWGSPWGWEPERCGGGGLSVRRVAKCLEACESDPNPEDILPEDCWLENRLNKIGFEQPDLQTRLQTFLENMQVYPPIGVHQFWTFIMNYRFDSPGIFADIIQMLLTFPALDE